MEKELLMICPMNVSSFPFDSHTCTLKFSSFARSTLAASMSLDLFYIFRKSNEMTFTKKSGVKPDELLDQEKVQDFDANASYLEVSMRPGLDFFVLNT